MMTVVNSQAINEAPGVGLLKKAFQILDLFRDDRPLWTQREIGEATTLPRSTVSRLVRFLCAHGYLTFQPATKRYSLGIGAIELGRRAMQQFDLTSIAVDILEEIARETRETVILTGFRPASLEIVCMHQIPSCQGGLRVFENIGATFPLYAGASTKPVLAHLPPQLAEQVLDGPMPPINPVHKPDTEALAGELETIRHRGYAISFEETYPGVGGVGAALVDPGGFPRGSLAIAVPMQRFDDERISKYGKLLVAAAAILNGRLAGEEAETARDEARLREAVS